ncbi:MAG: C4-dicarboxylate transporter DctQ subunit [Paraglaciecola sp.]|jgi:TRAP-type C4-dicarboxylate transport system permease small subunit
MSENKLEQTGETDIYEFKPQVGAVVEAGWLGVWIDRAGIIFAIGIVVAMLILIQEVFLRYVLNSPTSWAHETTIFICAVAFVYGGLYCAARNAHIRVVIIYDYVPAKIRRVLDIFISLVSAISALFFSWAAWFMVERAVFEPGGNFRLETSGSAWNPPTPGLLKVFMLVVMLVLALQFLILAINYARGNVSGLPNNSKQGDVS